jgi:hypothetical protein
MLSNNFFISDTWPPLSFFDRANNSNYDLLGEDGSSSSGLTFTQTGKPSYFELLCLTHEGFGSSSSFLEDDFIKGTDSEGLMIFSSTFLISFLTSEATKRDSIGFDVMTLCLASN